MGEMEALSAAMLKNDFPWYYQSTVTYQHYSFSEEQKAENFYFTHMFLFEYTRSNMFGLIQPIIAKLEHRTLIRVKANLYPRTHSLHHHLKHSDYDYEHKAALFYVNSNDGFTVLEDGTKIESVENRLLLFRGDTEHNSTTCTNTKARVNINFNYF